jgi:hypothetical protein
MTLTDNPFIGVITPHARRPRVSVLIVGDEPHAAQALEAVPEAAEEVILVGGRARVREGFAAATGECIVMMDATSGHDTGAVEGFIDALRAGWMSLRAAAPQEA